MVELIADGKYLQIGGESEIKYTFQINDLFDIANVNASYSNSFEIEKTDVNTIALKGLGLVGSASSIPYQKTPCRLLFYGFDVIRNGWLDIKETSDKYKINIIDGIIDFFKAVENKTIGRDLDLSLLNHRKTLEAVTDSFANPYYKYMVADYGGKTTKKILAVNLINIDYLSPSASIPFLWNKIFDTIGWTYSGEIFESEDFLNTWLTYPKAPESEGDEPVEPILIAEIGKFAFNESPPVTHNGEKKFPRNLQWSYNAISEGTLISNWSYRFNSTNHYRIVLKPTGYIKYIINKNFPILFRIKRGSTNYDVFTTNSGPEAEFILNDLFYQGEIIDFEIVAPNHPGYFPNKLIFKDTTLDIYRISLGQVDFNKVYLDYPIKDFIKEMIIKFGLTPVTDVDNKHVEFLKLDQRFDKAKAVDWTNKFVQRNGERYVLQSYAQKNALRHKYNTDNEEFRDGFFYVNNQNLQDIKTIFTSRTYAPSEGVTTIDTLATSFVSPIFPIWTPEAKEEQDEDGETIVTVDYKSLTGRFYVMKSQDRIANALFISEYLGGNKLVHSHPIASIENTNYNDLVAKYYPDLEAILNYAKIMDIEIALGVTDIMTLRMQYPVYFEQEASYFLLNKLQWEDGKTCTGEFIKLNI
jgi:hypothetical protein